MKFSNSLSVLLFISFTILSYNSVSCFGYMRHEYPTERILQDSGDISLPPNSFEINSLLTVHYQFESIAEAAPVAAEVPLAENAPEVPAETPAEAPINDTGAANETENTNKWPSVNGLGDRLRLRGALPNAEDTENNETNTAATPPADPTHITVAVVFKDVGQFFAIGWGANRMSGADIWVFEIIDGGVQISDRKATGHFMPPTDLDLGGTSDLELLGYSISADTTTVKVRRKIDTGDSADAVIQPGENNIVWATANGSPTIAYHGGSRGVLAQNLVAN